MIRMAILSKWGLRFKMANIITSIRIVCSITLLFFPVFSPTFYVLFSIMCGFTLGDYVRMRRLSLAADELIHSDDKVIDIALKYGYETPESFTRAFSRFHGITPTEARNGGTVKSFSKLSVKLILTGGNEMDYRIEKPGAIKVICKRERVHKPETGAGTPDITGFWAKCAANSSTVQAGASSPKFTAIYK